MKNQVIEENHGSSQEMEIFSNQNNLEVQKESRSTKETNNLENITAVHSAIQLGVDIIYIEVQISLIKGLPNFHIIGLPDTAVKESKNRVRSAIEKSGFQFPLRNSIINLSPSGLKKIGTQLDLPIALAILLASGQITAPENSIFASGELSLHGRILRFPGLVAILSEIHKKNFSTILIPQINTLEQKLLEESAPSLRQINYLSEIPERIHSTTKSDNDDKDKKESIPPTHLKSANKLLSPTAFSEQMKDYRSYLYQKYGCMSEVQGHQIPKRALTVSAIGGHNALLIGPPGCGKTMLARRYAGILEPLPPEYKSEMLKIHTWSSADELNQILWGKVPFRSPHHSSTSISLLGGGIIPRPGEISLAHRGVLFLDELGEFQINTLQTLRQIMDRAEHRILRNGHEYIFPADFTLIAATNPCKCGYFLDPHYSCTCSNQILKTYAQKINGPLMDRIDIELEIPRSEFMPSSQKKTVTSATIMDHVIMAKNFSRKRFMNIFGDKRKFTVNARMDSATLWQSVSIDKKEIKFLEEKAHKENMSQRSRDRVLSLARSIADMEFSEKILEDHIWEAFSYKKARHKFLQ